MKNTLLLFALFIGISVFGQEEVQEIKSRKFNLHHKEQPKEEAEEQTNAVWRCSAARRISSVDIKLISQPTNTNEELNGTMPLSGDLPFVHTIRGYAYTADYLRYTPRY